MISSFPIPSNTLFQIRQVEKIILSQADGYHPELKAALKVLLSSGGKRIRPIIIFLIGEMLEAPKQPIITIAAAIELLHTATLVHDDLIDGALLRRGVPTLNSQWSPSATVLTGDFLFSCSATLASECENLDVIKLFSKTLTIIVNGEINQMFSSHCNLSKENYYKQIYEKTASLFETSAQSAAILSSVSTEEIQLLKKYGYSIGMAFQIVDDILDYVGDETIIGKPVGGDLRQGLVTLPMLYYSDQHHDDPSIQSLISGNCINEEAEIKRLVNEIRNSSAIIDSLNEAKAFAAEAKNCLIGFKEGKAKNSLLSLTSYIAERSF